MKLTALAIISILAVGCSGTQSALTGPTATSPGVGDGSVRVSLASTFNDLPAQAGITCSSAAPLIRFSIGGVDGRRHLDLDWQHVPTVEDVEIAFSALNGSTNTWTVLRTFRELSVRRRVEVSLASLGVTDEARPYRAQVRYFQFTDRTCQPGAMVTATASVNGAIPPVADDDDEPSCEHKRWTRRGDSDNITWGDGCDSERSKSN